MDYQERMRFLYQGFEKIKRSYYRNHPKICNRCYSDQNIHLHHKIEVLKGGTHDFDNLIPLCRNCHYEWHNYDSKRMSFSEYLKSYSEWEYKTSECYKQDIYFILPFMTEKEQEEYYTSLEYSLKKNREERKQAAFLIFYEKKKRREKREKNKLEREKLEREEKSNFPYYRP